MTDRRRFGVIEVSRINSDTYHLTIGGTLWSEVEWSATRQRWCIQDAGGKCLAHEEHIVGMDRDPQAAIRRAKRMIISREMPAPEVALAQLEEKLRREELGEPLPWRPLDTEAELIAVEGRRRELGEPLPWRPLDTEAELIAVEGRRRRDPKAHGGKMNAKTKTG